jgi:hypothetical protein
VADNIEDPFAVETELLGLKLLPGQQANLRAAYAVLRDAIALVGADYPFEAEPAICSRRLRGLSVGDDRVRSLLSIGR